jgi:hypothetical protein
MFGEDKHVHQGRVVFGAMDEVVFGRPAAEAVVAQMDRLRASRAFLMVSGTLNRETDEIEKIRNSLGSRCAATFDAMPPHTPREAVIAAAGQARAANADLIVTVGGGSITDGAKAVQLCLANDVRTVDDIDRVRANRGVVPPMAAPSVRQISVPTTIAGGEFSALAGVTNQRTKVKEMLRHELVMPRAVILDPAVTPAHARMAVAFHRHPCRRPLCRGPVLARGAPFRRCAGIEGALDADASVAARESGSQRSRRPDGLPDRHLAIDGATVFGGADGRKPRHRLCAWH